MKNHLSEDGRPTDGAGGYSVLEAMIAAALGALIIGAALDVFVTHHRQFRAQRNTAEQQQALRGGVHLLASELRLAGAGGLEEQPPVLTMGPEEVSFRANVNDVHGTLVAPAAAGQDRVQVSPGAGWAKGKTVLVCGPPGCEEHLLEHDGSSGRLILSGQLAKDFPKGSRVEVLNLVRYYASRSDPKNTKLMREVDHGANPLIEHVEKFSLTYLNEHGRPISLKEEVRLIRINIQTTSSDARGGRINRSHHQDMGVRAFI
jgi:hypothetical protein